MQNAMDFYTFKDMVATVLTACGIETVFLIKFGFVSSIGVATVLTACGIETLQQWMPCI